MKYIVLLVPNWNYTEGGINSFNFDFALSLGPASGNTLYRVVCITYKPALDHLVEKATNSHVVIESLGITKGELGIGHFQQIIAILSKLEDASFFYFVGHDVFTGELANNLKKDGRFPSCSIVFHHMDYESYYAIKGDNTPDEMDLKFSSQTAILKEADYVVGIGPKLARSALNKVGENNKVFKLIPGLQEVSSNKYISKLAAITFGRYDVRNDRLKQMALAAKAFVEFYRETTGAEGNDATLKVMGISEDQERKDFIENATGAAGSYVNIVTLPYSTDRKGLFDNLVNSTVCLMLSVHEGFGLVGWEAIAAGVPLIVSDNTGLYEFLQNEFPGEPVNNYGIISCSIGGSMNGRVSDEDTTVVKDAFDLVVKNGLLYKEGVLKLRDTLLNKYSWAHCAHAFLGFLEKIDRDLQPVPKSLEEILSEQHRIVSKLNQEKRPQPVLQLAFRPGASELTYLSRSVEFSGREQECKQLIEFCNAESNMAWWTIIGEGGSGKSRLALELSLELVSTKGWYGGFLSTDVLEKFDWNNWAPAFDTLLVLDYAARFYNKVEKFLTELSFAAAFSPKKIRLLLLERSNMIGWEDSLRYIQERGKIATPWSKNPLFLTSLTDEILIKLIGNYSSFEKQGKTKAEVLRALKKIPKYNIPLYTIMLLKSLLQSGNAVSADENVFRSFIRREELEIWQKLLPDPEMLKKHKNLITLITLIGGMEVGQLKQLRSNPLFPAEINEELLRALNLVSADKRTIYAVEPDLLGEHFVVVNFFDEKNVFPKYEALAAILDVAWVMAPQNVLSFFQRSIYDFPEVPFHQLLTYKGHEMGGEYERVWCSLQGDLLAVMVRKEGVQSNAILTIYTQLEEVASWDAGLQHYVLNALMKIIEAAVYNKEGNNAQYYKAQLKDKVFGTPAPEQLLDISYFYSRLAKYLAAKLEIDEAEEFALRLQELIAIDMYVASESLFAKVAIELKWAKYRKQNIEFAKHFDFSHEIQINEGNLPDYEGEVKALFVRIQISTNNNNEEDALTFYYRLREITEKAPPGHALPLLRYQQGALAEIITFKLLAGEACDDLILEHRSISLEKHPKELANDGMSFWVNNMDRFLRANPINENIVNKLALVLAVDEVSKDTCIFYWECLLDIMKFHLENNDRVKALQWFQAIQEMFSFPTQKQGPGTASAASIHMSLFLNEDPNDPDNRPYYDLGKQYSEIAGTQFNLIYRFMSFWPITAPSRS